MARDAGGASSQQDGRRYGRIVVIAVVAVVLLAFVLQNRADTEMSWLFFNFTWPLWVLLAVVAVLAFGLGWLVGRRRPPSR